MTNGIDTVASQTELASALELLEGSNGNLLDYIQSGHNFLERVNGPMPEGNTDKAMPPPSPQGLVPAIQYQLTEYTRHLSELGNIMERLKNIA